MEGRRDANLSTVCTADPENQALMFGLDSINAIEDVLRDRSGESIVYSRSIKTAPIPVNPTGTLYINSWQYDHAMSL